MMQYTIWIMDIPNSFPTLVFELLSSILVHVPNFGGLSGSEDRGGGDNSIQIINFGRVGDKSFEEWRQKVEGWKGG